MSRVTLGASLLVAIVCLSLPNLVLAQSESGEPEASAPGERGGYGGEYGGRGGYGIAAATDNAEGQEAAEEGSDGTSIQGNKQKTSIARIDSALDEPLKAPLQYEDQPLNEIIDTLQDEYDIPILFDNSALEGVAISPDSQVTIALRNVTLRSALNLMLRQPGLEDLTFMIDDEVLLITTEEKANEKLVVEVYRVDDLTRGIQQTFGNEKNPYSSLVEVVKHCVAYDTWMTNGSGEGEIRLMQPGMLVVTNTRRVHEQVQQLLEKLRSARAEIDEDSSYGRGGGRGGRGNF